MKGVRTVDENLLKCACSFYAKDWQVFTTLVLARSVPFIVAGLHIGVGRGLVGVVIGEMLASQAGVGHMINMASATFQTDKVFVGIILLAAFGYFLTEILKQLEKYYEPWRIRKNEKMHPFFIDNTGIDFMCAPKAAEPPAEFYSVNVRYSALSGTGTVTWYAFENGLFEKYGLNVNLVSMSGGSAGVTSMISGDMDICQLAAPSVVHAVAAQPGCRHHRLD